MLFKKQVCDVMIEQVLNLNLNIHFLLIFLGKMHFQPY